MHGTVSLERPETFVPHAELRRLRSEDPVSWQSEPSGSGFWAVTRYHDVLEVLRNPTVFSSERGGVLLADPPADFLRKLRENLLNRDPPAHTRLRKLVNHVFSPKRIGRLEERIGAHARALVDRLVGRSGCDFATEVAGEMPLFVICEILGVPIEDRVHLHVLTWRMFASTIEDRDAALRDGMSAAGEMRAYGAKLAAMRRHHPAEDLITDLVSANVEGAPLTEGEIEAFFMLLFNAGADTTRSLLCHGLDLLLEHPDQLAAIRADLALLPAAIEEMLRYEPAVLQFRRTATTAYRLGGRDIAEGDKVVVYFASANRDETVFPDPDRFDIRRSPNPHLSFGHGTHFCLGAPLARMESRHVFRELLTRVDGLERGSPLVSARSNFTRSVRSQPVRFRAVAS